MDGADTYNRDFYAWANQQAALLRAGRLSEADIGNIAEEIESMGRSEKRELASRLIVLLAHLLKWQVQPDRRTRSWRLTIREQRLRLAAHLRDNPSLRAVMPEALDEGFRVALVKAQRDTRLPEDAFPTAAPWTAEQVMDDGFLPD